MPRINKRKFKKRKVRRGKKKSKSVSSSFRSLVSLSNRIEMATSQRFYRSNLSSVKTSGTTVSNVPVYQYVLDELYTSPHFTTILADTGVGGEALGDSTAVNSAYSVYNNSVDHQWRNLSVHPVFLDVWVYTLKGGSGYYSATAAGYDTLSEQFNADLYSGWVKRFLAADLTAQLKTSDGVSNWTGLNVALYTPTPYTYTPETSPDLNARWRKLVKHTVLLQPGQSFMFTDRVPNLAKFEPLGDATLYRLGRPGVCRVVYCRQYGDLGASTSTQYGRVTTQIAHTARIRSSVCKNNKTTYLTATAVAALPVSGTTVNGVSDEVVVA